MEMKQNNQNFNYYHFRLIFCLDGGIRTIKKQVEYSEYDLPVV